MHIITITALMLNIALGACEFTITNDTDYRKIYVSMNMKLADVVSEQTLIDSTSSDEEEGGETKNQKDKVVKKDFAVSKGGKGTTPFTKQFDIFVPQKSNGQYERRYRVHMKYCDGKPANSMKVSEIDNTAYNAKHCKDSDIKNNNNLKDICERKKTINMKRFDVIDFKHPEQACKAGGLCAPHASTFEHEHEYHAKIENKLQVREATQQEIKDPGYLPQNPNAFKDILP